MKSSITITVLALLINSATQSARADLELNGLVMHHDYFLGSLSDLTGNGRNGTLGSGATLVPQGTEPGYVDLAGGVNSHVMFPTSDGATTLSQLAEANGGDLTVELWLDFDPTNAIGTGDGNSRFNVFSAYGSDGSDGAFYFDYRQPEPQEHDMGGTKDGDIINGAYRGGDAARLNVEGLHHWVYALDGNQPGADGTWSVYRDGVPVVGNGPWGSGLSGDLYKTTLANFFTATGVTTEFTVGGEAPASGRFGVDPKGKLYRTLIYDQTLSASQVQGNFDHGLNAFGPPAPPPKEVTVVTSGGNAPDTEYMNLNVNNDLGQRPFNGIGTWIAEPTQIRTGVGRLHRVPNDAADIGQTVVHKQLITPTDYNLAITDLQTMPTSHQLNKNFLHIYLGNHIETMDWFDNNWWGQISHNIGEIAKVANQGGLEGILIDPEAYSYQMWGYNQLQTALPSVYGSKTFAQVEAEVRQRGNEFGAAINAEYPDSTIMFFHAASFTALQIFHNQFTSTEDAPFGLMVPFLDGILESTSAGTKIVDTNSWTHQPNTTSDFQFGQNLVAVEARSLSAVPQLFDDKVKVGHFMRTSYDPSEVGAGELFDPNNPNSNYYSPAVLQASMEDAIEYSDGYVLFWEGFANWWLDSASAMPIGGAPVNPNSLFVDPVYWESMADAMAKFAPSADFDKNGMVNGLDFLTWQTGLGATGTITAAMGDANGDNSIDGIDVDIWMSQYGNASVIAASAGRTAVPEPGCQVLVILGLAAVAIRRHR